MTFTLWSIGFTVSRYEAVDSDIGLVDDEDDPAFGNDYVEFETQVLVRGAAKLFQHSRQGTNMQPPTPIESISVALQSPAVSVSKKLMILPVQQMVEFFAFLRME